MEDGQPKDAIMVILGIKRLMKIAYIEGNPERFGIGTSYSEALGDLIEAHPARFGLSLKYPDGIIHGVGGKKKRTRRRDAEHPHFGGD